MALPPDFDEFCALLIAKSVEFVIVGAHALAFHGAPRFTGDLDVLVRPTEDNANRLINVIAEFGFPTASLTPETLIRPDKIIEMGVVPVQIYVMSHIDGVTWDEVWTNREEATLGSNRVSFIGRSTYLKNKQAAGRPKDLADIEALREIEARSKPD